ncbi:hypothetical protein ACFLYE_00950 [Chloroflexota bacterium]
MKYILGMAKSHLDLRGAKGPKLELDYLRLVYAIKEMRKEGYSAQGYLVVMTEEILNRVRQWEYKYRGTEFVKVMIVSLTARMRRTLENDKKRNVAGMVAGTTGGKAGGRSNADTSRDIGEAALTEVILRQEPDVQRVRDESKFPLSIRWDFYGVVR